MILFIAGFLTGGFIGVLAMAMCAVSKSGGLHD